jgi:hypothetical protein
LEGKRASMASVSRRPRKADPAEIERVILECSAHPLKHGTKEMHMIYLVQAVGQKSKRYWRYIISESGNEAENQKNE